jgi:orotate phosphoribosyltransferase-like protein
MKINGMTDYRYKVTQQDILDMRELRKLGFKVKEIADSYNISTTTVVYWTNDKSRAKQRLKNARRRTNKEDMSQKVKRDMAKRLENIEETPMTFVRHSYHSRKADIKSRNMPFKTMYGHDREVWDKIMEQKLLNRPNGKMSL